MSLASVRTWYLVHKWTSLACTLFLLVICLTGLPLVFSHEIYDWLDDSLPYAALPSSTPAANLDGIVAAALERHPREAVRSVFIDDDEPQVIVTLAPAATSPPELEHSLKFDARTAQLLKEYPPADKEPVTFMGVMYDLHTNLFAKLPGELFLAVVALAFVTATVSGVVLYGPFMKKLPFGAVRPERGRRIQWLDVHNLLGIATLVWVVVVGVTGFVNELSTPLFALWRVTEVKALLAPHQDSPASSLLNPAQATYDAVRKAMPAQTLMSIDYPNPDQGTPQHFVVWTKGNTPLTSKLFTPALVEASTGKITAIAKLPWYLKALEVSRPLHFGDYGGLPLKVIWALLDLVTIAVLGSGLYLWWARRKATTQRIDEIARRHAGMEESP